MGFSRRPSRETTGQSGVGRCSARSSQRTTRLASERQATPYYLRGLTCRSTASVDAIFQNSSALCSRARMFMPHAFFPLRRGRGYILDESLEVTLVRRVHSAACAVFGSCLAASCSRVLGWVPRVPGLGLRRWNTSFDTKEVFQRLRPSLRRLCTCTDEAPGSLVLCCAESPTGGIGRPRHCQPQSPLAQAFSFGRARSRTCALSRMGRG